MSNTEVFELVRAVPRPPLAALVIGKSVSCAISVAQVVIGAVYLDDCPQQPYIPIYLIVSGTLFLLATLLSFLPCTKKPEDGNSNPLYSICLLWNSVLSLFLTSWFIAGNVWIYSIYEPNYNSTSVDAYCDKTLYLFAFWTTTIFYIAIASSVFLCCCGLLCMICGKAGMETEDV